MLFKLDFSLTYRFYCLKLTLFLDKPLKLKELNELGCPSGQWHHIHYTTHTLLHSKAIIHSRGQVHQVVKAVKLTSTKDWCGFKSRQALK